MSIEAVSYEVNKLHTRTKLTKPLEYEHILRKPKIRTHCFGLNYLYRSQQCTSIN